MIAAVVSSRRPRRTLLTALVILAIALNVLQLTDSEAIRLGTLLIVGAALGPLYPLAIASTLDLARNKEAASSQSTAAIGAALLAAPAMVGTISDTISPIASINFVTALVVGCALIAGITLKPSRAPTRRHLA